MIIDRELISQLMPHQGTMSLLAGVRHWNEQTITAFACSHRALDNPLRSSGQLRAVHLSEYGAQAAALHGGLRARVQGGVAAPGYLVSLRDVRFGCQRIDDLPGDLEIHVELLLQDNDSWQYRFDADHAGTRLATGRLAIIRRR